MSRTESHRHVAVLIETSKTYGRGLLEGIASFVRTHRSWSLFADERSLNDPLPGWFGKRKCDGVLLRSQDLDVVQQVRETGIPTVYLGERFDSGLPLFISNDRELVQLGVDDLINRGYRSFGFVSQAGAIWSERREGEIRRLTESDGIALSVYSPLSDGARIAECPKDQQRLAEWLKGLPRPTAVIASYDVIGVRVLETCREFGISVPEEVAVMGIDNDQCFCELADPPLSSVAHDLPKIGYQAAAHLDELMAGRKPETFAREVTPLGVITRQSSDTIAVEDKDVADALQYIREHACDGINVQDVLDHVPLTRITLKRRFERILGRSAKAEIVRLRIQRVCQLLAETDLTLDVVAELSGFKHPEYLSTVFRQKTALTPGEYRRRQRVGAGVDFRSAESDDS